jgi:hypothetical protein
MNHIPALPLPFYPVSNRASNSTSGSHCPAMCARLCLISLHEVFGNGIYQSFPYSSGSQASVIPCHPFAASVLYNLYYDVSSTVLKYTHCFQLCLFGKETFHFPG